MQLHEMMDSGFVEWVCQQAVDSHAWNLLLQLINRGMSTHLKNALFQSVLENRHVQCTAKLMDLGVSKHCREEGIQQQIAAGHGDFVLEVVKSVRDPDLIDFVLLESMKLNQWAVVSGLVRERLTDVVMKSEAQGQQGPGFLQMLIREAFLNDKLQDVLASYPPGSMPEGLVGPLLMAAVKHGQGAEAADILQKESISDSLVMEAIKLAVGLRDKITFIHLIRACPRSRRVFKQKFVYQQWRQDVESETEGGEISWIVNVLINEHEVDLAVYVATCDKAPRSLLPVLCNGHGKDVCLKPKQIKYVLTRLYDYGEDIYCKLVKKMYRASKKSKQSRSLLFRHSIRVEEHNLTCELYDEYGVSRKDLTFLFSWLVQDGVNVKAYARILKSLTSSERRWLNKLALKCSMNRYFMQQSDYNLNNFIKLFKQCDSTVSACDMFRKAVTKCVELNYTDCFLQLCEVHLDPYRKQVPAEKQAEDWTFMVSTLVAGNRGPLIHEVIKAHSSGKYGSVQLPQLTDAIIERKAFHLLHRISSEVSGETLDKLLWSVVHKMLLDQCLWPDVAPALDQWVTYPLWKRVKGLVRRMSAKVREGRFTAIVVRLKKWCVAAGHVNLAAFLALVTDDWDTLRMLGLTLNPDDLHHNMLWGAANMAERSHYPAVAALLKLWPVNRENITLIQNTFMGNNLAIELWPVLVNLETTLIKVMQYNRAAELAQACEEEGLLHWALVLKASSSRYILEKHKLCKHQVVIDFIFEAAVRERKWDIALELIPRCTHSALADGMLEAVKCSQLSIVQSGIHRVDPTTFENNTLLCLAVRSSNKLARVEMVKSCLSAGLSSFQRELRKNHAVDDYSLTLICEALAKPDGDIVKLLLASGAITYKELHEERDDIDEVKDEYQPLFRCINEAAANPLRLRNLARLAASHSIGYGPGRSERINRLACPVPLKDLINFTDVLSMDLKTEDLKL